VKISQSFPSLKHNLPNFILQLFSVNRCEEVYSDFVSLHQNQHLCAGNMDGRGGTCVGDSGGGLQCKFSRNGPWILAGITSFGSGCAKKGYPDVYTNVRQTKNQYA
jgi:secreted trypsin-like serine protease